MRIVVYDEQSDTFVFRNGIHTMTTPYFLYLQFTELQVITLMDLMSDHQTKKHTTPDDFADEPPTNYTNNPLFICTDPAQFFY